MSRGIINDNFVGENLTQKRPENFFPLKKKMDTDYRKRGLLDRILDNELNARQLTQLCWNAVHVCR
jgi:hypothetical protein